MGHFVSLCICTRTRQWINVTRGLAVWFRREEDRNQQMLRPAIIGHVDDEALKLAWVCFAWTGPSQDEKVIKFGDCYHGHADPFLIKAGSGVATLGLPDSPGIPKGATYETLNCPFSDFVAIEELFETNKEEIAALILEPVVRNSGFVPPKPYFLNGLYSITKEYNALLIFDKVMTGFRLSYGGAQEYFGITPDLNPWEDYRWWSTSWCMWREEGYHGDGCSCWSNVQGRNLEWESFGYDSRYTHAKAIPEAKKL